MQLLSQDYKFVKFSFNQLFSTLYNLTWLFMIMKKIPFFGFGDKFGNQEKETSVNLTKEVFFRDKN